MTRLDPSQYRARTREITLPSGVTVVCRKPNLQRTLNRYNLLPVAIEAARAKSAAGETEGAFSELSARFAGDAYAMSCALICDACVEPVMVLEPTEGAFSVQDLEEADHLHLQTELWAWQGLSAQEGSDLAPFCQPGDGGGTGGSVGQATE